MAEALFRQLNVKGYSVFSAGTKLSGHEQKLSELPLASPVVDVMREEGIDVSNSARKQITPEMIAEADTVVLISENDEVDEVSEELRKNKKVVVWDIPDPKGTSLDFHRKVRDEIKQKIYGLVGR